MKKDAVRKIVNANIKQLMWLTQTQMWHVDITYGACTNEGSAAEVTMKIDYNQAHIVIDPAHCTNEADVLKYLRHELIHLLFAPMDLYTEAMFFGLGPDERVLGPHRRLVRYAAEHMVLNIERLLDHGTKPPPAYN